MLRIHYFKDSNSNRYMGGCQNYGPLLGPLNIRFRIILRTPKRTVLLTTTHVPLYYTAKGYWQLLELTYFRLQSSRGNSCIGAQTETPNREPQEYSRKISGPLGRRWLCSYDIPTLFLGFPTVDDIKPALHDLI